MTKDQLDAYHKAEAADAAFHAELVRQFGAKNAGDARYDSIKHDERTRKARFAFRMALDAKRRADHAAKAAPIAPSVVDVASIDDNNGAGPQRLSNSVRCF